jgi:hypothetical protein
MIYTHHDKVGITCTTLKPKGKWCCKEMNLDSMVLEERMIECRLFGDVDTVYDISIWALLCSHQFCRISFCNKAEKEKRPFMLVFDQQNLKASITLILIQKLPH